MITKTIPKLLFYKCFPFLGKAHSVLGMQNVGCLGLRLIIAPKNLFFPHECVRPWLQEHCAFK